MRPIGFFFIVLSVFLACGTEAALAQTATATHTVTPTVTGGGPSRTPTLTPTSGFPVTFTYTPTITATPTVTGGGPIYTATMTHTKTYTPTITATPTVTGGSVTPIQTISPTSTGATATQTPPCANQVSFGVTFVANGAYLNEGVNQITANQTILPASATITNLSINVGDVGGLNVINLAIYSDDGTGNAPGTLIVSSGPQTMFNTSGWNMVEISPTYLTAGTYWLCYSGDSKGYPLVGLSDIGSRLVASAVGFPQNFPSSSSVLGYESAIYMSFCQGTYTPQATATITLTATRTITATPTKTNGGPIYTATITPTPTMTATHTVTPTVTGGSFTPTPYGATETQTPPCANQASFGVTTVGGGLYFNSGFNQITANQAILPTSATITSLSINVETIGGNNMISLAIYSDDGTGNAPGSLIVSSGPQTMFNNLGWNTVDIPPTDLAAGTYWLCYSSDSNGYPLVGIANSGNRLIASAVGFPQNFPSSSSIQGAEAEIYASFCQGTYTPGNTHTPIPTITLTPVLSFTPTWTKTSTPTATSTPLVTGTVTGGTPAQTATLTFTKTMTFTPTITATPTVTGGGPNNTATLTATHTMTFTPTITSTPTITATPTVTGGGPNNTATLTATHTMTFTPTITSTPTITVTPTVTGGGPIYTATITYTPTMTATHTMTPTITATYPVTFFSPSPTATIWGNPPIVPTAQNAIPYPNPSHGGPIFFQVAGGPYDSVTLSIYTTGMRRIFFSLETLVNGGFSWDLLDKAGDQLSNGIYWAVIETTKGGVKQRYTRKVLILR